MNFRRFPSSLSCLKWIREWNFSRLFRRKQEMIFVDVQLRILNTDTIADKNIIYILHVSFFHVFSANESRKFHFNLWFFNLTQKSKIISSYHFLSFLCRSRLTGIDYAEEFHFNFCRLSSLLNRSCWGFEYFPLRKNRLESWKCRKFYRIST